MALVSLELAARHLKYTPSSLPSEIAEDLTAKAETATAIVLNYLDREDSGWNESTDPANDQEFAIVQAAILKVLGNLWRHRGDAESPTPLSEDVLRLLLLVKDPSIA